jgi:hypothetical protein
MNNSHTLGKQPLKRERQREGAEDTRKRQNAPMSTNMHPKEDNVFAMQHMSPHPLATVMAYTTHTYFLSSSHTAVK